MSVSNSKIYKALSLLSVYERNRFKKYLCSPFFNQREDLVKIFDILNEDIRENELNSTLIKEDVFQAIHLNGPYDDKELRRLFNLLITHLENFLATVEFLNDPLQKADKLLLGVYSRRMSSLYNSSTKQAKTLADRQLFHTGQFYHDKFSLEQRLYDITGYEEKRREKSNLDAIDDYLNISFIIEKLRNHCNVLIRKFLTQHEYNDFLIKEILDKLSEGQYRDIPAIDIYYSVFELLSSDHSNSDSYYFQLKSKIESNIHIFPKDECLRLIPVVGNYFIRRMNQCALNFHREVLNVYKLGLEKDLLVVNNRLSQIDFKNIVIMALRLKEFKWADEFMNEYIQYIDPEKRQNANTFNRARYYFYKKDYDKVLPLLAQVEFEDFSYNLASKAMLLATYYETDEFDALLSFMDSFRTFLNRNKKKLNEDRRQRYLKTIRYVRKLMKAEVGAKSELDKIEQELDREENIADIRWLKEKIDELR